MKIIIAGAGQVGVSLAKYLREENHDIVLIDESAERLGNLSEQLDIQTIQGSASYPSVLDKAGAEHADVFLAVTGNDEVNIVSCGVAKFVFNIQKRIARISSGEYLLSKYKPFLQSQSIEVILSPEVETANRIMQTLPIPGAVEMVPVSDGLVQFVGLKIRRSSPIAGKTLEEFLPSFGEIPIKIVAVTRRYNVMDLDEVRIRSNDDLYFVIDKRYITQVLDILGYESLSPRYIIIFGGGKVGWQLAKLLEDDVITHDVTVVEKDEARARFLAEKLQNTLVISGDGLDESLIEELNLKNYSIAITTTQSDESNILLSLLSKRNGIPRTMALIHNDLYDTLLNGLGVDSTLDPNAVMVSSILQHIRKGRVKSDYFVQSGIGEMLEIEAVATSKITKSPLGRIKLPLGVEIGGVIRGGLFMLPNKDLIVKEKDKVLIFVERGKVGEVEKLFSVGFSFF